MQLISFHFLSSCIPCLCFTAKIQMNTCPVAPGLWHPVPDLRESVLEFNANVKLSVLKLNIKIQQFSLYQFFITHKTRYLFYTIFMPKFCRKCAMCIADFLSDASDQHHFLIKLLLLHLFISSLHQMHLNVLHVFIFCACLLLPV